MFQKYWWWANQIVPFGKIKEKTTMCAHPSPLQHSLKLHFCMFERWHGKHNSLDCDESNIKLKGLFKNVISIITISRSFQYHHHLSESSTSKTFIINRYQLLFALAFCFTGFKAQGQTFDNLIIDLQRPHDNMCLHMHNMYITLSCLWSIEEFKMLWNITIQDICKTNFKN